MEIAAPKEWLELAQSLDAKKGTVLLLGSTDTGKSTLARYLVRSLVLSGVTVTLVDADIGQSSLGLPGTVSFTIFRSPEDVKQFRCQRFSFIGSVNPVPVMPFLIKETRRFASLGRISSQITLIDTTGLVVDGPGRRLKSGKIKAVRPDRIIAIERKDELEHILELVDDIDVVRLKPSPLAKQRSPEARNRYRERKLAAYFKNAGEILLPAHAMEFFFHGRPLSHKDVRIRAGALVGLNHHDDTYGLGIVTEIDPDSITLETPLHSLSGIRRVLFGTVKTGYSPED